MRAARLLEEKGGLSPASIGQFEPPTLALEIHTSGPRNAQSLPHGNGVASLVAALQLHGYPMPVTPPQTEPIRLGYFLAAHKSLLLPYGENARRGDELQVSHPEPSHGRLTATAGLVAATATHRLPPQTRRSGWRRRIPMLYGTRLRSRPALLPRVCGVTCEFVTRYRALDGREQRGEGKGIRTCALLVMTRAHG